MFSYRHGFHAGNHADVLKHIVLLECMNHLMQKDTPITLVDTHAGAGFYSLQDQFATTSGECSEGIHQLQKYAQSKQKLSNAIERYLKKVQSFNEQPGPAVFYPGSPALMAKSLRPNDKLRLFELHPSDITLLSKNMGQFHINRQTQILEKDGFDGLKAFLPPPSRRALVLIDPSYEDKTDYSHLIECISDALKRFATGIYAIWYPHLDRQDAQELPNKLKEIEVLGKPISWLHALLQVKDPNSNSGLYASGMFIINPPWKLKESLEETLPILTDALAQDDQAQFIIESFIP